MLVSHKYESQFSKAHVKTGVDLVRYHVEELRALRNGGQGHPLIPKRLPRGTQFRKVFAYYGLGSKALDDEIAASLKAGIQVEIMTDLNRYLKSRFQSGARSIDFENAEIVNGETGRSLLRWLQAGMTLNTQSQTQPVILSQPLFDESVVERPPIFHLKESYTVAVLPNGEERVLYMTLGTANMVEGAPRYNRMFVIDDPDILQFAYHHYQLMKATFKKGGTIVDVPSEPPLKVIYRDGSSFQLSYTDGKINWNLLFTQELERAANQPEVYVPEHILMSNFVFTFNPTLDALRRALAAHPALTLDAVFDQKFLSGYAWGIPFALIGGEVYRPMGKSIPGLAYRERMDQDGQSRVNVRGWLRRASGYEVQDLDGPPIGIELWHDKTDLMRRFNTQLGQVQNVLKTGNFNHSGNFANQEAVLFGQLGANSWVADAIRESVTKVVERYDRYAIAGQNGFLMEELGRFLGIGYHYLTPFLVNEYLDLLKDAKFEEARGFLVALGNGYSSLRVRPIGQSVERRVDRLIDFLKWLRESSLRYDSQNGDATYIQILNAQGLNPLLRVIWDEGIGLGQVRWALGGLVYRLSQKFEGHAQSQREFLNMLQREAWNVLQISALFDIPAEKAPSVPMRPKPGFAAITLRIFDVDDLLIKLPTKIILFQKNQPEVERAVSTEEFARLKPAIDRGSSRWVVDPNGPNGGSFRNFSSDEIFLSDVDTVLNDNFGRESGMAPGMEDFLQALSDPFQAQWVVLNTARGSSPDGLYEFLVRLKTWAQRNRNLEIHLPPKQNLIPIGHADFRHHPESGQLMEQEEAKAYYILTQLKRLNDFLVQNPNHGRGKAIFYDDFLGNVMRTVHDVSRKVVDPGLSEFPFVRVYARHVIDWTLVTQLEVRANGDITQEYLLDDLPVQSGTLGITPLQAAAGEQPRETLVDDRYNQYSPCELLMVPSARVKRRF